MLYRTLKCMIERGQTEAEYSELIGMLNPTEV